MASLLGLVAAGVLALALFAWGAFSSAGGVRRGLASGLDITTSVSRTAVRRNATITRPATRTTWRTPGHHAGIEIGRVRWFGLFKRTIYAGFRDIILILAPPGSGKTGLLAGAAQDAVGALVAASSRADLFWKSITSRLLRPIYAFNPDNIGDTRSHPNVRPVKWNPVAGCRDENRAWLVAGLHVDAVSSGGRKDAEFWDSNAVRLMRCLLAAADCGARDMHAVYSWINAIVDGASSAILNRPITILDSHPAAPAGWAADLRRISGLEPKQLGSIALTLSNCVQYMAHSTLAALATPSAGEHFDVDEFLRTGASLYIIGKHRSHDPVGPLFAALTGVLFETAVQIAETSTGHRLDPPLTAVLDEATNIFRGPLDMWTSYFGGSGIPMVIAAQSRHQLREAFGDNGEKIIWDNSTVQLAFGGVKDPETLRDLSTLCGDRACEIGSTNRRPTLTASDIFQLSDGQGARPRELLIVRRSIRPVIAYPRMVWERRRPPIAEPMVAPEPVVGAEIVHLADRRAA